jgi:hypothetical protein
MARGVNEGQRCRTSLQGENHGTKAGHRGRTTAKWCFCPPAKWRLRPTPRGDEQDALLAVPAASPVRLQRQGTSGSRSGSRSRIDGRRSPAAVGKTRFKDRPSDQNGKGEGKGWGSGVLCSPVREMEHPARWTGSVRLLLDVVAEDDIAGGRVQGTVGGTPGSTMIRSWTSRPWRRRWRGCGHVVKEWKQRATMLVPRA